MLAAVIDTRFSGGASSLMRSSVLQAQSQRLRNTTCSVILFYTLS
jgi:hypothetical protein